MATIDLPDNIERQLYALDRQVRDATFARGISRLGLIVPIALGLCLAADWMLALGNSVRFGLLLGWVLLAAVVTWREILRHVWRPPSFAELAALVERQHPELKERLSCLVELRDHDAPGASPLMRDLLARQTAKAVERLDLTDAAPAIRSPGTSALAFLACLLLLAPFVVSPADYGLLWARMFAPWGNFHWGTTELIVVDGDRVVARGSDVPIQIELRQPRHARETDITQTIIWLHWTDAVGIKDSRRLEWDADSQRFATMLPRIAKTLTFHATTTGAQSELHRIDVADPPTITRLQLDVAPPAYTGLAARSLDGAQGEVHAIERSRVVMKLEFNEPVTFGELAWPIPAEATGNESQPKDRFAERKVPMQLSADKRSATAEALAVHSGPFAIRLKNGAGLSNEEPPRSLVVDPDLPPAVTLVGNEQPVSVRPDDRHLISVQVKDDFGLTAVELYLESSTGKKRMDAIPIANLQERSITHEFPVDIGDFELTPGQALTYRIHAVDNRPVPAPQETWTKPRTLMVETRSSAPADKELAQQEQDAKEQVAELRKEIAETKQELEKLHRQTEDESLKRQNSDKAEQLTKLEQQQAEIAERLQKLAAELSERPLTEKLAERAQELADRDLAEARQRLEQAKNGESRDQLQPLSESIDRLASVDKKLQSLDQQLSELNRLEQDLARLEQLARNTDRLAEKLEQLDQQSRPMPDNAPADAQVAKSEPGDSAPANGNDPTAKQDQNPGNRAAQANDPAAMDEQRQKLQAEGQKLSDELNELFRKHPELLDAARRDQLQRLEKLAEQAAELAKPQEQLAKTFQDAAAEAPASAERPTNNTKPAEDAANATPKGDDPAAMPDSQPTTPDQKGNPEQGSRAQGAGSPESNAKATEGEAGAKAAKAQQQLAQEATRQARELAQQDGADSKATQAATDFAKQAAEAARQAQTGKLDQASKQAEQAANTANEAARELNPDGQPASKQSQQAAELAQRQQQVAEQLQQLAGSKAAQQGAQQQGQQQLAEATESLAQRLEQTAKNLESSPLDSKPGAEAASKAQESARDAQQAMKQAAQAAKSDDAQGAAEQASRAAEKLQQAAQQAQDGPPSPESGNSIPEELATKVTQAAQQLQQAQQQLNSAKSEPKNPENQPGQGQPGQGQRSELAQSAEQFRRAAAAMRRAIQGEGQPGNGPSTPGGQQAQANSPNDTGEPGQPGGEGPSSGGGATTEADVKQLDAEFNKLRQRNWGRLPGQLRTEILQGSNKKPRPEYAKQIKSYFEEIAKPTTREATP